MRARRSALTLAACAAMVLQVACSAESGPAGPSAAPPSQVAYPTVPMSSAPTLYVAPEGDDAAPGTSVAPLRTIAAAADRATPGITVSVADGTYEGSVRTRASGTDGARIAYVSKNRWGAKIVGSDRGSAWRNDGDFVDIVGFDISGANSDGLAETGSKSRLVDNRVHGFKGGNCITTANDNYDLRDIDVLGNVVFGCGSSDQDHGIYVSHPGGTVANNISYGNTGYGIHCWHNCNNLVISNNLVFDNATGGIVIGQGDSPNYGNVAADNFVVANNIAVDNRYRGIGEQGATGPNNRFTNNILYGNDVGGIGLKGGIETDTIDVDPEFVNYIADGSGDYRLLGSSPAIDTGTPGGAPGVAADGTPRPQGGGIDIGIYEQ